MKFVPTTPILETATPILETAAKYRKLLDALHDAIRRPMGVIPSSAEPFVTDEGLKEAEVRRTQLIISKNQRDQDRLTLF